MKVSEPSFTILTCSAAVPAAAWLSICAARYCWDTASVLLRKVEMELPSVSPAVGILCLSAGTWGKHGKC